MEQRRGVLIVIPCLNEVRHIRDLLMGLMGSSVGRPFSIVVVDGGSEDGTVELVRELADGSEGVRLLHNPRRLQSAGVNLAVQAFGDGVEFMIRIDAHAEYPHDYCRILVEEAEQSAAAAVVVGMNTTGDRGFQRAVAVAQNSLLGNGGAAHRTAKGKGAWVDHGHHALIRVDAYREIGGYDESFAANEDAELDMRLRRAGHAIWMTARTAVDYHPRSAPGALLRQYFKHGRGRARTILKHRAMPKLRQLAPAAVLPTCVLAMLWPFTRFALVPLATWMVICIGYGLALAVSDRKIGSAVAGVAAMIMHFGWSAGFWSGMLGHRTAGSR